MNEAVTHPKVRERQAQLAANLQRVRTRLEAAATACGRSSAELTLIAVTKRFPRSDLELLIDLGVRDVGESTEQEARDKLVNLDASVTRHFIGHVQSNKAARIAAYSDLIHSLDRPKLIAPVLRGAQGSGRAGAALIQVNLDPASSGGRSGVPPADVLRLADLAAAQGLAIAGVMAVAPLNFDSGQAFAQLRQVSVKLRQSHPQASIISAGMSGDLEAAIAHGATHLRVGGAILGSRPAPP